MDYQNAIDNIRRETKEYLVNNNIKSVILGISGGIDSTLVAALIKPICTELNIPLIGRSITIESNTKEERERAINVGKLCTDFDEVNLTAEFKQAISKLDYYKTSRTEEIEKDSFGYKIRMGNMKARMRMMYLYNLASMHNGLVLSTDNYTEYMLGFWTLHGDVGDFGMIQDIYKTHVYEMSEYLARHEYSGELSDAINASINCDATDGLGITKTDLDQIMPDWRNRHSTTRDGYAEVDKVINMYLETGSYPKSLVSIVNRIKSTEFKRENPFNIDANKIF